MFIIQYCLSKMTILELYHHILSNPGSEVASQQSAQCSSLSLWYLTWSPLNTHGIGMLRLVRIIEQRPDLYDELIIDRVIGLASYLAEGVQGSAWCSWKKAIILQRVADKGQTADQIFTVENTHAIIPKLMWQTSPIKKGVKTRRGERGLTTGGHLGGIGHQCLSSSQSKCQNVCPSTFLNSVSRFWNVSLEFHLW